MTKTALYLIIYFCFFSLTGFSQSWQQKVDYDMQIDFDVLTHRFESLQVVTYYNNSPDTLYEVFFHLYLNAFQPGSMMDVRSRTVIDPDSRIGDKILYLKESEIGFQRIDKIKQGGKNCLFKADETLLSVMLASPILPNSHTKIEMNYKAQIPIHIRRCGRNNAEGVEYTIAQWYPKLCVYDNSGWNTDPYVSKEFYGDFGDFDVKIKIDRDYTLAGTGVLMNANKIGHGYEENGMIVKHSKTKLNWHFSAENVHDFVWVADREFRVVKKKVKDGPIVYFVYQSNELFDSHVELLQSTLDEAFSFANKNFGKYPYPVFSFIQGGDGGMEYPMTTVMTFDRTYGSFLGTGYHELMHAWYYGAIANNELKHGWMDEGLSDFSSDMLWKYLADKEMIPGARKVDRFSEMIQHYVEYKNQNLEEPLSLHADHYVLNYSYYQGVYLKGEVFFIQLMQIIGENAFKKSLLEYYERWKFKHPTPDDFIRIAEKNAGINLDWYHNYWIHSTRFIDYAVDSVFQDPALSTLMIDLSNKGNMPMPLDVYIEYEDQTWEIIHVPLRMMRGAKPDPEDGSHYTIHEAWPWTHPTYQISFSTKGHEIHKVVIDPDIRIADSNRLNNTWKLSRISQN